MRLSRPGRRITSAGDSKPACREPQGAARPQQPRKWHLEQPRRWPMETSGAPPPPGAEDERAQFQSKTGDIKRAEGQLLRASSAAAGQPGSNQLLAALKSRLRQLRSAPHQELSPWRKRNSPRRRKRWLELSDLRALNQLQPKSLAQVVAAPRKGEAGMYLVVETTLPHEHHDEHIRKDRPKVEAARTVGGPSKRRATSRRAQVRCRVYKSPPLEDDQISQFLEVLHLNRKLPSAVYATDRDPQCSRWRPQASKRSDAGHVLRSSSHLASQPLAAVQMLSSLPRCRACLILVEGQQPGALSLRPWPIASSSLFHHARGRHTSGLPASTSHEQAGLRRCAQTNGGRSPATTAHIRDQAGDVANRLPLLPTWPAHDAEIGVTQVVKGVVRQSFGFAAESTLINGHTCRRWAGR